MNLILKFTIIIKLFFCFSLKNSIKNSICHATKSLNKTEKYHYSSKILNPNWKKNQSIRSIPFKDENPQTSYQKTVQIYKKKNNSEKWWTPKRRSETIRSFNTNSEQYLPNLYSSKIIRSTFVNEEINNNRKKIFQRYKKYKEKKENIINESNDKIERLPNFNVHNKEYSLKAYNSKTIQANTFVKTSRNDHSNRKKFEKQKRLNIAFQQKNSDKKNNTLSNEGSKKNNMSNKNGNSPNSVENTPGRNQFFG